MITLYDYLPSQNAYKVRLLLNQLEMAYKTEYISIFEGEGQRADYLAINPSGAVPAIKLENGEVLAESNAILAYLAHNTVFLPSDPYKNACVMQWLFFEADYVQSTIATLRHWVLTDKHRNKPEELLAMKAQGCEKTLTVLDRVLKTQEFLAAGRYTIADMAVFAYTHLCEDTGVSLSGFTNVKLWIERIKSQPGYLDTIYPYSIDAHSGRELA